MRLLIIEDDRKIAALLATTLREEGFDVICKEDGTTGLEEAIRGSYDILLVDIMLPNLDGLSLVRELRSKNILDPVLMLSARGEVEQRVEGLSLIHI